MYAICLYMYAICEQPPSAVRFTVTLILFTTGQKIDETRLLTLFNTSARAEINYDTTDKGGGGGGETIN